MDQRTPLSKGASVRNFIIDKRIGDGASCLVYGAHYLDSGNHRKEIILKECYPYNAGITRVGSKMIWSNPAEKNEAFVRFNNAYEIAAKIQNTAGAQSVSVYSLDQFEENGTLYVATIPNGNSYDKNESEDIADILRTTLALTNAIGLYHKAGYLHLDIKPSNFIATEDQTGKGKNIVLFDVDTVVLQEDVQNGNLRSISYSKEFAAPEQKMQQIKEICPATDLFAVGAVLFERIMNRPVECFDSGLFATWDYDSRFDVKKVNPKAKRLLTEIFHKTLAANVKRRYQSAEELAEALGELVNIVDGDRPYIYSPNYVSTCNFVGRSEELAELREALADGKPVFVKGAGGIGKTELVRKYVSLHRDEYDAVVFMLYNGSVSECLNQIEIYGVDEDKRSVLKGICDENVLLILDNYDVAPNESNGLNELFDLNCKIIVTTRTDFSERNPNAHFIEVSGLSPIALRVIFENESELALSDSEFEEMQTILHVGQECTYFWSMIARLAKEGAYTISEIVEKVNAGLIDLEDSEDVFDTKDGNNINTTVAAAMLALFKLDELNDKDFEVLKAMYFLDCLNMDKRQIKEMLVFSENKLMNSFNALVKKGYIQRLTVASREVYRISDVLRNVLEYKEELDISKVDVVTSFIDKKFFIIKDKHRYSSYDNELIKDRANYVFACLFKIFSGIKWSISDNDLYCINKLYNLMAGKAPYVRITDNDYAKTVINNIMECLTQKYTWILKIKIHVILITYFCCYIHKSHKIHVEHDTKTVEAMFEWAIAEMESHDIKDFEMLDYLCQPFVYAISEVPLMCNLFSASIITRIIDLNPPCLHNKEVNHLLSFNVRCLRNNEFEKIHLKNTLDKVKKAKRSEKARVAYLAIGLIALNGSDVPVDIDNELRKLRAKTINVCRKEYFGKKDKLIPDFKKSNIKDFKTESVDLEDEFILNNLIYGSSLFNLSIKLSQPYMLRIEKNTFSGGGLSFGEINAIDKHYPTFIDKKDMYSIDIFISSIDIIDSADCLYYFISVFGRIIDSERSVELEDSEKQKYIYASKELEKKLLEIINAENNPRIFDGYELIDCYEIEAHLNSIVAVMYDHLGNYKQAYLYLESLIEYLKSHLNNLDEADKNDTISRTVVEKWLWMAIYRLNEKLVVPFLYRYIEIIRGILRINDAEDERLYKYYKELVRAAKLVCRANTESIIAIMLGEDDFYYRKSENEDCLCELDDYRENFGIESEIVTLSLFETKQDYEGLIEKYSNFIRHIIGQEYHP